MSSNDINVVAAFIAAINRHALGAISDLMTENHTFVDSLGQNVSGREAMISAWKAYFGMFPDYEIRVERMLTENGIVAVFGSASGTYKGKRGLVPENRIVMPAAWRAGVENGKVKLWQVYSDWTEGVKTIEKDRESG
jgi:limonene-1,2-epoxide hydrolase